MPLCKTSAKTSTHHLSFSKSSCVCWGWGGIGLDTNGRQWLGSGRSCVLTSSRSEVELDYGGKSMLSEMVLRSSHSVFLNHLPL